MLGQSAGIRSCRTYSKPTCFVLHSTGSEKLDEVVRYYSEDASGVCPHFLVDRGGAVTQFVEVDHVAYHVGLPQERIARKEI